MNFSSCAAFVNLAWSCCASCFAFSSASLFMLSHVSMFLLSASSKLGCLLSYPSVTGFTISLSSDSFFSVTRQAFLVSSPGPLFWVSNPDPFFWVSLPDPFFWVSNPDPFFWVSLPDPFFWVSLPDPFFCLNRSLGQLLWRLPLVLHPLHSSSCFCCPFLMCFASSPFCFAMNVLKSLVMFCSLSSSSLTADSLTCLLNSSGILLTSFGSIGTSLGSKSNSCPNVAG